MPYFKLWSNEKAQPPAEAPAEAGRLERVLGRPTPLVA